MNGTEMFLRKLTLRKNKTSGEREAVMRLGLVLTDLILSQFPAELSRIVRTVPIARVDTMTLREGTVPEHIFGFHDFGAADKKARLSVAAWPEKVKLKRDEKTGWIILEFDVRGAADRETAIFGYENFGEQVYVDFEPVQMELRA